MRLLHVLTIATIFAAIAAEPKAYVFLVMGQSNSVGSNSEGHTEEDVSSPNILQTSCCHDGTVINDDCSFILAQDPLHHECGDGYLKGQSIGFGMSFARELIKEISEDDFIVLVPSGLGGTGFVDNVWTAYNGTGFNQAVLRLSSTFRILALEYPQVTASLEGFLWHQGEADAIGSNVTEYLFNDLIPMIEAFRDTGLIPQTDARVPFVAGNLLPAWVLDENHSERLEILASIQFLPQFVSHTATAPSFGLTGNPNETPTIIHFSAPSQRNFGRRYFAAWKEAITHAPIIE